MYVLTVEELVALCLMLWVLLQFFFFLLKKKILIVILYGLLKKMMISYLHAYYNI